jgi:hypothetical protein
LAGQVLRRTVPGMANGRVGIGVSIEDVARLFDHPRQVTLSVGGRTREVMAQHDDGRVLAILDDGISPTGAASITLAVDRSSWRLEGVLERDSATNSPFVTIDRGYRFERRMETRHDVQPAMVGVRPIGDERWTLVTPVDISRSGMSFSGRTFGSRKQLEVVLLGGPAGATTYATVIREVEGVCAVRFDQLLTHLPTQLSA